MKRFMLACASLAPLVLWAPSRGAAHALPAGLALAWPDAASTHPTILTNRGVVFTSDAGAQLRCNEAFFFNTSAYPSLWVGGSHFAVATPFGVLHSSDLGCTLPEATGLPDLTFGGFGVLADADQTMLIASAQHDPLGGLFASHDHGVSFDKLSDNVDQESFTQLLASPDQPQRVYASGFRFDPSQQVVVDFVWAVSDDGGATFTRTSYPDERTVFGVVPGEPDHVFAYQTRDATTGEVSIFQSSDAGKTFRELMRMTGKPSFVSDDAGSTFWLGAAATPGLLISHDQGASFVSTRPELTGVSCLAYHGGRAYACARHYPLELGVWSTASDADALRQELVFEQVTEPVACGGPDVCTTSWTDWSNELLSGPLDGGSPAQTDAGTAVSMGASPGDAAILAAPVFAAGADDAGAAAPVASTSHGSSGCGLAHASALEGAWLSLLLIGGRRRRRAHLR